MYLTLPSSASREEYPENIGSTYTTLLSRSVELGGLNEVGLCEVILPVPCLNLSALKSIIYQSTTAGSSLHDYSFPNDVKGFADLEKQQYPVMNDDGDPIFQFSFQEGRLSMVISEGWQLHFASETVAKSLGYMHNLIYRGLDEPSNRYFASLNKSVDIAYIYCDICEYSPVGDVMAPLLRAIPLKWNEPTVHRFDNIHYINLMSNRFHTIRIEICTDLGKEIVFPEGISLIKLHIRTKKKMTQE